MQPPRNKTNLPDSPRQETRSKRPPRFRICCHNRSYPMRDYRAHGEIGWGGQTFLLRNVGDYLLFRPYKGGTLDSALFFREKLMAGLIAPVWLKEAFAEQYPKGELGRFLFFAPEGAKGLGAISLFFHPDGSGFALDGKDRIEFAWDTRPLASPKQILQAPSSELQTLCQTVFETQVNPRLTDPFVRLGERQNPPYRWLSGSEAQLRSMTRAICHTEPSLFARLSAFILEYGADETGEWRRFRALEPEISSPRLSRLCRLAYTHNEFRGMEWRLTPNAHRASHYHKGRAFVNVRVQAPSAHERAEAWLELTEWLETHVPEAERRELLALPTGGVFA